MTYILLSFFLKLLSYIPFGMLYVLSDCLYYPLYYIVRYRRKVVRRNLMECFPEKSEQEIKRIEQEFYHSFTDQMLESCKMASISPEEMKCRMKFTNVEEANAVLRSGKSIALYIGHFGNWEWVSSMPLWSAKEAEAVQIYHKLSNENMDRLILHNRGRMGAVSVEMRNTARYITGLANAGKVSIVGFIADHSPRRKDARHFLPFLHHSTPVLTGTEKIIKHYGFEAWFLDMKRVKRGYYEAELVRIHETPQMLPDFDLTAMYFQMLEEMILDRPELYLWTHNRFKYAKRE